MNCLATKFFTISSLFDLTRSSCDLNGLEHVHKFEKLCTYLVRRTFFLFLFFFYSTCSCVAPPIFHRLFDIPQTHLYTNKRQIMKQKYCLHCLAFGFYVLFIFHYYFYFYFLFHSEFNKEKNYNCLGTNGFVFWTGLCNLRIIKTVLFALINKCNLIRPSCRLLTGWLWNE